MGIININNESFFSKSRVLSPKKVAERFLQMAKEGADYIDFGACSTKPGSTPVSEAQEIEYLQKPLKLIAELIKEKGRENLPQISIDTFRSSVVRMAYSLIGPFTVNDISAGEDDTQMLKTVSELNLPYIAMHKRGTPSTMGGLTDYPNGVVNEVLDYFKAFSKKAEKAGIKEWILDPGFGFAKTIEQNYQLLSSLEKFKAPGKKVLVGISRKSMIYKLLDITPEEALPATCALNFMALTKGADILRVHDVKEAVQCVKMYNQIC